MARRNRAGILTADEAVVPVVEETAVVRTERVATDAVRLHKRVREEEEALDVPVQAEAIEVERVPVGRWVDGPTPVRRGGDTTVYPVVEEVLVVEKRLRLVEEVRVTLRRETRRARERVRLRREEVVVERGTAPPAAPHRDPDRGPGG